MPSPLRSPGRLAVLPLEDRSVPAVLLGLEADGLTLVAFDSDSPGTAIASKGVTGLETGASLVGIDYRPSNGKLYGVSSDSRLYTIDAATGAATQVGAPLQKADGTPVPLDPAATAFGVDFNPAADKLRIISNTNQNLRVVPDTGVVAGVDPAQAYDPATFDAVVGGTPPAPQLVATAYTKNLDPAGTKTIATQYVIDSNLSLLSTQGGPDGDPSPNTGVLFPTSTLSFTPAVPTGFDIEPGTDAAFVTVGDKLYSLNLTTAAATSAALPAGLAFRDIAVQPPAAGAGEVGFTVTEASFDPATRGPLTLTVTRTGGASVEASVTYATADGTATAGEDYLPASGTLTFAPGETTKTITLLLPAGPAPASPAETFTVTLSAPTGGATLGANTAVTVTIPAVTGPAFAGTFNVDSAEYSFSPDRSPLVVTVTRTGGLTETATVGYTTADGTATAAVDYVPAAGLLTFAPGESTKTVTLTLPAGTPPASPPETFLFRLFNPSAQATLGGVPEATITIPAVTAPAATTLSLSAAAYSFPAARGPLTVTVTRGGDLTGTVTVDYATADGTATAGTDYVAATGTLTFAPGETAKTVALALPAGSAAPATAETFTLILSDPSGAGAGLGAVTSAVVTIPAAGATVSTLSLSADQYAFIDRNPVTITVLRSGSLAGTVSVSYATVDGTAVAGTDYVAATGTLTFAPGESSKSVVLALPAGAPAAGPATTFTVVLSAPTGAGAVLGDQRTAAVTVPAVAAPGASTLGLSSGTFTFPADRSPVTVTVTRGGSLTGTVTVAFATAAGTAAAGTDFVPQSGTLTFAPGETSKTVTLAVPAGSTAPATAREFTLTLSSPTGGAVLGGISTATVTIPAAVPGGGLPEGKFQPNGQPAIVAGRAAVIGAPQFAVGGANGTVTVLNPDRTVAFTATAFPGFAGSVRTAVADFNGDGIADVAAAAGPGSPPRVVVIDGATRRTLFSVSPFEESFTGGAFVAVGELTGDGVPDLVVTPDEGGGPRVRVFSGAGVAQGLAPAAAQVIDFFGIQDAKFFGGARAAVGDLNGDGRGDLIVAAGFGGGPRVAVFDGRRLQDPLPAVVGAQPPKLRGDFFVYEERLRNGAYVSAGDVTGDGVADLITGAGPGGGPRVSVFESMTLLGGNSETRFADFFAGDEANRDGVRVAAKDLDNDGRADLVTAAGTGRRVTAYAGKGLPAVSPTPLFAYDTPDAVIGGVFVG